MTLKWKILRELPVLDDITWNALIVILDKLELDML